MAALSRSEEEAHAAPLSPEIVERVKRALGARRGSGERPPTVRQLAVDLAVSPQVVREACATLGQMEGPTGPPSGRDALETPRAQTTPAAFRSHNRAWGLWVAVSLEERWARDRRGATRSSGS